MYGCESWTIKKAKCQKIDAFELLCWRRLLRVPWTTRRSNQSTLKEICPGCSLEGLMLKLKLQYFSHLMRRSDSLEKTMMLGRIGGRRRRGWLRMRWLDGITDSWTWVWVSSGSLWWTGRPGVLRFMGWPLDMTEWLDWTKLNEWPRVRHGLNQDLTYPHSQTDGSVLFGVNLRLPTPWTDTCILYIHTGTSIPESTEDFSCIILMKLPLQASWVGN